jgi:hypothetical protein
MTPGGISMTRTLLTVAACLLVPGMAAAQYNNAPPPGYNAPPPGYNAPPPGYNPPPPGYNAPPPGYNAPPPGYNAPPPGYNAPPPSGYSPGPGPGTPPGYYPTQQAYASPPPSAKLEGLVLSVELGYGPGFGDLMKDTDGTAMTMSDGVSGYIPLVLGVGYRVNPLFSFGGVFQYAVTRVLDSKRVSTDQPRTRIAGLGLAGLRSSSASGPLVAMGSPMITVMVPLRTA